MGIAQKVSRDFSDAVRSRGQSYFAKGRVAITSASASEVVARVRGTAKYRVRLRLRGGRLHATCSCPYFGPFGDPCKHLWATVLAADARRLLAAAAGPPPETGQRSAATRRIGRGGRPPARPGPRPRPSRPGPSGLARPRPEPPSRPRSRPAWPGPMRAAQAPARVRPMAPAPPTRPTCRTGRRRRDRAGLVPRIDRLRAGRRRGPSRMRGATRPMPSRRPGTRRACWSTSSTSRRPSTRTRWSSTWPAASAGPRATGGP